MKWNEMTLLKIIPSISLQNIQRIVFQHPKNRLSTSKESSFQTSNALYNLANYIVPNSSSISWSINFSTNNLMYILIDLQAHCKFSQLLTNFVMNWILGFLDLQLVSHFVFLLGFFLPFFSCWCLGWCLLFSLSFHRVSNPPQTLNLPLKSEMFKEQIGRTKA